MEIRRMCEEDYSPILLIAEKLKTSGESAGWFSETARKKSIPLDIRLQKGFVAVDNGVVAGFVTYTTRDSRPIIGWIGVDPEHHRKGIGKKLLERVEEEVKTNGGDELCLETPSKKEGVGRSYEHTYKFYGKMGFKVDNIRMEKSDEGKEFELATLKKQLKS